MASSEDPYHRVKTAVAERASGVLAACNVHVDVHALSELRDCRYAWFTPEQGDAVVQAMKAALVTAAVPSTFPEAADSAFFTYLAGEVPSPRTSCCGVLICVCVLAACIEVSRHQVQGYPTETAAEPGDVVVSLLRFCRFAPLEVRASARRFLVDWHHVYAREATTDAARATAIVAEWVHECIADSEQASMAIGAPDGKSSPTAIDELDARMAQAKISDNERNYAMESARRAFT